MYESKWILINNLSQRQSKICFKIPNQVRRRFIFFSYACMINFVSLYHHRIPTQMLFPPSHLIPHIKPCKVRMKSSIHSFIYKPESISSTTVTLVKSAQSTQVCLLSGGRCSFAMSSGRSYGEREKLVLVYCGSEYM